MRPPICHVCNATPEAGESRAGRAGDWIAFADYEPLPEGMVGHPRALGWFCPKHVAAARALSSKSMREALAELERVFGRFSDRRDSALRRRSPLLIALVTGALIGVGYPILDLAWACRSPESEACVWGKAYFSFNVTLSVVLLGGAAAGVLYVLLMRRRNRDRANDGD